jgi:hypothetical protein
MHRLYQQKRRQAARIVIAQLSDDPPADHADRAEEL